MSKIFVSDGNLVVSLARMHKLLALRSRITVPLMCLVRTRKLAASDGGPRGFRVPGIHIPGLIAVGTYRHKGKKHFWDVVDKSKCIVLDLIDHEYASLTLEVDDPDEAIRKLEAELEGRPAV